MGTKGRKGGMRTNRKGWERGRGRDGKEGRREDREDGGDNVFNLLCNVILKGNMPILKK